MKEDSTDDPDPTLSLEIDDLLGQAYYKYARDDEHHPESWQVLKALFERNIEGKHVPFHSYVVTPEEREEIEKDKQLPYYSTAFAQGAPRSKCIRGTQRGYCSKPLNITLLNAFLNSIQTVDIGIFLCLKTFHLFGFPSWKSSEPKIIGIKTYLFENFSQKKAPENSRWPFLG